MAVLRALARVNLTAIERNCARLREGLTGGARLCAVVKADGYGHGALPCARAAQRGGASWLAVASAGEAQELRRGAIELPILVLGALSSEELTLALAVGADVVAWTQSFVDRVAALGGGRIHVKLDSGMGRLGTRDAAQATRLADAVARTPGLQLIGAMTHFATADEPEDEFLGQQLQCFGPWAAELKTRHPQILVHAANSAATLRDSATHLDMVRCGIAIYGMDPFGEDAQAHGLEAALELRSYVAALKPCAPGQSAGYGRRFIAQHDTVLAVLPIGYGDGWRRALTNNADVLIGARRHPLVGAVSMDNITVDVGDGADGPAPALGSPAVLIGRDGAQRITCEELARRLNTINYEITCGLTARVPRHYHHDGEPDAEAASDA